MEKAEEKKQEMLYEYLKDTLEQLIKQELTNTISSRRSTAVAAIESQKDNPQVQEVMNYMDTNSRNTYRGDYYFNDALSPFLSKLLTSMYIFCCRI